MTSPVLHQQDTSASSQVPCNVCGGTVFKAGPSGRLFNGKPPVCVQCGAMERHRVYRAMIERFGLDDLRDLIALQFSRDPSVEPAWFRRFENSVYGQRNSMDIQKIPLPEGAYDVIICNHILEHVPDDRAALSEMCRIMSPRGFVFLSVPNPIERQTTADWGCPDPDQYDHYRIYGMDIVDRIKASVPQMFCVLIKGTDPVTGREDMAFVLSKRRLWHDRPIIVKMRAKSVNIPSV